MANNGIGSSKQDNSSVITQTNLECKNLYEYLKTLPKNVLERLYNHPAICLAVYR